MGVETHATTLMSPGYAPKLPSRLNLCIENAAELQQKRGESNGNGHGLGGRVKSCVDDELVIEEVLSEWWGCRALMQRIVDHTEELVLPAAAAELEAAAGDDDGPPSGVLSLPDDVTTMIFAQLPRQSLAMARRVCSSWKRVAEQQELASMRRKVRSISTPTLI